MTAARHALALRVSDSERERVADFLRLRCGEGRLALDELSERLDAVYAARVGADLAPLVADLPDGRGALPGARAPRRRLSRRARLALVACAVLAFVGLVEAAATAPLALGIALALLAVVVVLLVEVAVAALPVVAVGWLGWLMVRWARRHGHALRLAPPR